MTEFVEKQLIYHRYQSGYGKNHSTTTLLNKLYDDIKTSTWTRVKLPTHFCKLFQSFWYYWFLYINIKNAFTQLLQRLSILGNGLFNFSTAFFCTNWRTFFYFLTSEFGVPRGSILGLILFNLCVADMSQITPESECLQYADDTTLYWACKTSQRDACINSIEKDIQSISRWSNDTNFIFNSVKTKVMVISTPQCENITKLKKKK